MVVLRINHLQTDLVCYVLDQNQSQMFIFTVIKTSYYITKLLPLRQRMNVIC